MLILGIKYYYNQLSDNNKINLDKILKKICLENIKIAVIDLGHVALPLAHAFSSKYKIVGFDIAHWRIDELRSSGYDRTLELSETEVKEILSNGMKFTNNLDDIKDCNIYIVTVPTPIDKYKKTNLTLFLKASELVGKVLKPNDIVIYESTVY